MATPKFVHNLRAKPIHVRERLLILSMAVVTPLLLTIWYAGFRVDIGAGSTVTDIQNTFKQASTNPVTNSIFMSAEALPANAFKSGVTDPLKESVTSDVGTSVTPGNDTSSDTTDTSSAVTQ